MGSSDSGGGGMMMSSAREEGNDIMYGGWRECWTLSYTEQLNEVTLMNEVPTSP